MSNIINDNENQLLNTIQPAAPAANVTVNQLDPLVGDPSLVDNLLLQTPIETLKWSVQQATNFFNKNIINNTKNILFVSSDGSDTTGDGSLLNPFATVSNAYSVITGNTFQNTFSIFLTSSINDPNQINLKPYVSIVAATQGCQLNNSLPIKLDPSFGVVTNQSLTYFQNITFLAMDLDSSSFLSSVDHIFQFNNVFVNSTLSLNASATNGAFYSFYNSFVNILNAQNVYIYSANTNYDQNVNLGGNVYNNQLLNFTGTGNIINNLSIIAPNSLSYVPLFKIEASELQGNITLNGGKCELRVDAISHNSNITPALTNGALYILDTETKSLTTSYTTPANFTPTNSTLDGTLQGIDNALASSGGSSTPSKFVYASQFGNDTTGNGTYSKPYATVSKAISTITTNSDTNTFEIIYDGTIIETGNLAIKPYVNLTGHNLNSYINTVNPLTLDASFGTISNNYSVTFSNFRITSMNLDTSSFGNSVIGTFTLINVQVDTSFTNNCNSSNYFNLFFRNVFGTNWNFSNSAVNIGAGSRCANLTYAGSFAPNTSAGLFMSGGSISNSISITVPALAFTPSFNVYGTQITGSQTYTGAQCVVNMDASSYKPGATLNGGASISLISVADGVNANFTPTNYTPVDGSVNGHLRGINSKVAPLSKITDSGTSLDFSVGIKLPTTGGTPSPFSTYEETTFITNTNGALVLTNYTLQIVKTGRIVNLIFPAFSGTAVATGNIAFNLTLPTRFRPISATPLRFPAQGARNTLGIVIIEVQPNGIVLFYGNTTLQTFQNGQLARLDSIGISYFV